MIIIKICSGLGNQMFQYAFLLAMKKRFPKEKIVYDDTTYIFHDVHHGFELSKYFNLDTPKLKWENYRKIYPFCYTVIQHEWTKKIYKKSGIFKAGISKLDNVFGEKVVHHKDKKVYQYTPEVFDISNQDKTILYEGYWQNINYYLGMEKELREVFDFTTMMKLSEGEERLLELIENSEAVGIHVRRGDYINNPAFDLCNKEYFQKAIDYLTGQKKRLKLFFFTDDRAYVEEVYKEYNPCVINHPENSGLDMYLMSRCKHNIIANSSYSFWAAYLNSNEDKVVVAPKYVYRNRGRIEEFSVPETWHIIDNLKVNYE